MEEETSGINRRLSTVTLISPPPPSPSVDASPWLPLDLVEEILARLPVKFLLQFRCVCKSWNSLISDDPKFAKKHIRFSKTNRSSLVLNTVISLNKSENIPRNFLLKSYPIKSPFTTKNNTIQFHYPPNSYDWHQFPFKRFQPMSSSCDGILCLNVPTTVNEEEVLILWNPSIRKLRELPPLEKVYGDGIISCGLGYDYLSDNYKVVAVHCYLIHDTPIPKTQVMVHSLGTNFWRKIQEFPYCPVAGSPKFVCGKPHWTTFIPDNPDKKKIVSLDLGNESYQEVLQPDYGEEEVDLGYLVIGVLNDCLSMLTPLHGVWVMKEYGNKESWTKIFGFSYIEANAYRFTNIIYIFENDQVLLQIDVRGINDFESMFVVYDSKIVKFHTMDNTPELMVESLISP